VGPIKYSPIITDFDTFEVGYQPTLSVRIVPRPGFIPFNTTMIVDSGSEDTLLHESVGLAIGLDVRSGKPKDVGGITGGGIGYEHSVKIELKELGEFLEVDAIFVPNMGTSGILGQRDFFNKYDVLFKRRKLEFILKKVSIITF
jgi:hypothetical protein